MGGLSEFLQARPARGGAEPAAVAAGRSMAASLRMSCCLLHCPASCTSLRPSLHISARPIRLAQADPPRCRAGTSRCGARRACPSTAAALHGACSSSTCNPTFSLLPWQSSIRCGGMVQQADTDDRPPRIVLASNVGTSRTAVATARRTAPKARVLAPAAHQSLLLHLLHQPHTHKRQQRPHRRPRHWQRPTGGGHEPPARPWIVQLWSQQVWHQAGSKRGERGRLQRRANSRSPGTAAPARPAAYHATRGMCCKPPAAPPGLQSCLPPTRRRRRSSLPRLQAGPERAAAAVWRRRRGGQRPGAGQH